LYITVFGITEWHEIFVGSIFSRISHQSAKIKSHENKLPPKKFRKKILLLFTLLNFNEIGCKQRKMTIWLPFLSLSSTTHDICEKIFPGVKFEIQICKNLFPQNLKNPKSAKLNSCESLMPQGIVVSLDVGIVKVFVFQTI